MAYGLTGQCPSSCYVYERALTTAPPPKYSTLCPRRLSNNSPTVHASRSSTDRRTCTLLSLITIDSQSELLLPTIPRSPKHESYLGIFRYLTSAKLGSSSYIPSSFPSSEITYPAASLQENLHQDHIYIFEYTLGSFRNRKSCS
ncbi:hypothetical protein TWF718_005909 [Orbilia javanica]|uniref:Uncharacterized protein n=1 Tax=Orbilia javanica TaxID=47235 RepID=A0AAN8MSK6_9PEZI